MRSLLESALLAPSSHNTQPWSLKMTKDTLFVYADFSRRLLVGDPTDRELYISIGHLISHFLIAAEHEGYISELKLFPNKSKNLVATIKIKKTKSLRPTKDIKNLYKAIHTRMTNRSLYKPDKKLPDVLLTSIQDAMYEDIELRLIEDKKLISDLADLTKSGIKKAFSNKDFRDEVAMWIRHNWTEKKDGMPGYTLGIPDAISIMAPAAIRSSSIAKETSLEESKMVKSASAVGVLIAPKDNKKEWVKVGISSSNFWLNAEVNGVSMAILSAAVEMPDERKKLAKLLKTNKYPCLFFRLGYPTKKMRPAPRRDLDDVLTR